MRNDSESPKLSYHLKTRPAVETVGARIALAQTELEVDGAGAYRAKQTYQVDNGTEQFLELELPAGAELWTALVAGEPVRPQAVPNAKSDRLVRLPLVKTTTGDLDYPVVVTYGGQLGRPGSWTSGKFPFLKTRNISVELSRVRLLLPETHRWFNFGGTLGQVNEAGDYEASFLEYQTKRIMRLSDVLRSESNGSLMKMRASNNLKQLAEVVKAQQSQGDNPAYRFNDSFVKNNAQLNSVVDQARQQVEQEWKAQAGQSGAAEQDNRDRLQQRFDEQSNQRARNVVNQLGANFYAAPASPPTESAPGGGEAFNANWFATNGLVRGVDVGRVNMGDQSRKS
ncbi:MAG TPA: hypothetical protein PLV92_29975, partial [Pirellulaceae bacterium]|nr:hypothetical protein [Pirellulaceae bacterium]